MILDEQLMFWILAAVLLLGSEFVSVHLFSGFLGAGAAVVALLRFLGLVEGLGAELAIAAGVSTALLLLLRSTLARLFGRPETSRATVSDEVRLYGSVVEVVAEVRPGSNDGRVRIDGTSWPATSSGDVLPAGSRARLLRRETLVWVVDSVQNGDAPAPPAPPHGDS